MSKGTEARVPASHVKMRSKSTAPSKNASQSRHFLQYRVTFSKHTVFFSNGHFENSPIPLVIQLFFIEIWLDWMPEDEDG